MASIRIEQANCRTCACVFTYVRYSAYKQYCSTVCKKQGKKEYDSQRYGPAKRTSPEQARKNKMAYWLEYARRPEVKERRSKRYKERYQNEPAYRQAFLDRALRRGHRYPDLPNSYTGHRWFDLARRVVGEPPAEGSLFYDSWAERMGEAVLALLEGRDMKESIHDYYKKEYVSNHLTERISEWHGDNEYKHHLIGGSPSAEEEAERKESTALYLKTPFNYAKGRRRAGNSGSHGGHTAPSRREGFKGYQDRPGNRRG